MCPFMQQMSNLTAVLLEKHHMSIALNAKFAKLHMLSIDTLGLPQIADGAMVILSMISRLRGGD